MTDDISNKISPGELGRRLAVARKSRNLTQDEVSQRLGMSRPTLVAIEKGVRPVKPEELTVMARLYGRSVHELVSGREFVADFAPLFRMTQTAQASGISDVVIKAAVETFQQACEDYLALENLLETPMPRYTYPEPYAVSRLSARVAAEDVAINERSRLSLGLGPLQDPTQILENEVGMRVFALPLSEFRIAGMFAYSDRLGGCVLVNAAHPATRRNWSLAHEYAHFLVDRFQEDVTVLVEYERKPKAEQFADAFAASFLMPGVGLRQRFNRIVQSRNDFTVSDLCLLADQYAVSVEAMALRLESLTCIPGGAWAGLRAQGYNSTRVRAQLGLATTPVPGQRLPERYVQLAVQAFEGEKITESELARLLRCSRVETRETVDRLTGPTGVDVAGDTYRLQLDFGGVLTSTHAARAE
jgi:Zn-dependent peptidase ImmA (M78 family)/transcriptional regulator with XRE-family HTH domain